MPIYSAYGLNNLNGKMMAVKQVGHADGQILMNRQKVGHPGNKESFVKSFAGVRPGGLLWCAIDPQPWTQHFPYQAAVNLREKGEIKGKGAKTGQLQSLARTLKVGSRFSSAGTENLRFLRNGLYQGGHQATGFLSIVYAGTFSSTVRVFQKNPRRHEKLDPYQPVSRSNHQTRPPGILQFQKEPPIRLWRL
jgi:hypothetical protein